MLCWHTTARVAISERLFDAIRIDLVWDFEVFLVILVDCAGLGLPRAGSGMIVTLPALHLDRVRHGLLVAPI